MSIEELNKRVENPETKKGNMAIKLITFLKLNTQLSEDGKE